MFWCHRVHDTSWSAHIRLRCWRFNLILAWPTMPLGCELAGWTGALQSLHRASPCAEVLSSSDFLCPLAFESWQIHGLKPKLCSFNYGCYGFFQRSWSIDLSRNYMFSIRSDKMDRLQFGDAELLHTNPGNLGSPLSSLVAIITWLTCVPKGCLLSPPGSPC